MSQLTIPTPRKQGLTITNNVTQPHSYTTTVTAINANSQNSKMYIGYTGYKNLRDTSLKNLK